MRVSIIKEIRDLSKHQDLPFSEVLSSFLKKLRDIVKDNVELQQGTNYINLINNKKSGATVVTKIYFQQSGKVIVQPNDMMHHRMYVLDTFKKFPEELTDEDLDHIIERIKSTTYLPKSLLK